MISFKAGFVSEQKVYRITPDDAKLPRKASFVELKFSDLNDVSAVRKVNKIWGNYAAFAADISNDISTDYYVQEDFLTGGKKYFALTSQKTGFEKLNPEEILGLCEVKKLSDKYNLLEYIQVDPKSCHSSFDPEYRGLGTAIINGLKNLSQSLILEPVEEAVDFYIKNGFIKEKGSRYIMYLKEAVHK